jgi:signal peptidase
MLKNIKKPEFNQFVLQMERKRSFESKRSRTKAFLIHLRTITFKPKLIKGFLPLIILFLIVILLLNNYLYFAVITSDSMSPTFSRGDMVLMTKFSDVEEGDIIMFPAPDMQFPVVHRVHGVEGPNITTKGDFNPTEDSWSINESEVMSEAVMVNDKPIVMKGVGTYFLEDYEETPRYSSEIEFNRILLQGMQTIAIYIFLSAVFLYIYFTLRDSRGHKK